MAAATAPERPPGRWREPALVALGGAVAVFVLWHAWGRYLPAPNGRIGIDYALFLPWLLNGLYWFQSNGPFAVPWFTPAFCGGLPMYPDPQSVYYSVPQALALLTDPLRAVRWTFVAFGFLGFVGMYALLSRRFGVGWAVALLGATVFTLNAAFPARMVIGHLPYHSLALTPVIAYALLRPHPAGGPAWRGALGPVAAGLLFAYAFQSGNVHTILPMALAVAVIGLVHAARAGSAPVRFLAGLAGAVAVAATTSAAKLWATLSFLAASPRAGYPLPGASDVAGLLEIALRSLFLAPADGLYRMVFENARFTLERFEFEMSVTVVPALILVSAAAAGLARLARRPRAPEGRRRWLLWGAVALLLAVPFALNVYTPEWNAVLQRVPVVRNSSTLVRWFFAYVPVIALAAALAVERLRAPSVRAGVAGLCVLLVAAITLGADRSYYLAQKYDPAGVVAAHTRALAGAKPIPVSELVLYVDRQGRLRFPIGRNDAMVQGRSAVLCFAPIFGYRLEWLPRGLAPGPTFAEFDGRLNLFDPACFVFPGANQCRPGDRFEAARSKDAGQFVQYRAYPFALSGSQKAANALNLAALAAAVAFLVFAAFSRVRRRRR